MRGHRILFAAMAVGAALTLTACSGQTPEPVPAPTVETPATSIALSDLLTIDVPSLCEHPEGALVDGDLPGIAENEGFAGLGGDLADQLRSGAESSDRAFIGTDADGTTYLAATMDCNRGGVSWPSTVVVWNDDLEPIASFHPEEYTGGDREFIAGIAATDTGFIVRWTAPNSYDAACCHQLSAETGVDVDVAAGEMDAVQPAILRGEEQVVAVFEAALAGETADGIEASADLYAGITSIAEKGGEYDLDGLNCEDVESSPGGTLICGIPVTIGGEERAFIVYPTLSGGWNDYAVNAFDLELW